MADNPVRQVIPPEQPKALFAEAEKDRDHGRAGKNGHIQPCIAKESSRIPFFDGRHEVASNEAVEDVHAVDGKHEQQQAGRQKHRFAAHVGFQEHLDGARELAEGLQADRQFVFFHSFGRLNNFFGRVWIGRHQGLNVRLSYRRNATIA